MTTRRPARTDWDRPALRRAPAIGLLVLLSGGLSGCGDPDGGGGGGGGYVAQQTSPAPARTDQQRQTSGDQSLDVDALNRGTGKGDGPT